MKLILFLTLTSLMMSCSQGTNSAKKEYGYVFEESTGQNQYVLVDSKKIPIKFSNGSNEMALRSLQALKPSVLYGNSDGKNIFVVGEYDASSSAFKLDHWYIKVPFVEYVVEDETQVPHVTHQVSRRSLERADFTSKSDFDPLSPSFDPRLFEKQSSTQED